VRRLLFISTVLVILSGFMPGVPQASPILGLDIRLQMPQTGPPFDATATVVDPAAEFQPFGQVE
jgi:hypothetical protein